MDDESRNRETGSEMNTVRDHRWDAADMVLRKSLAALERLRNAQALARLHERELADGETATWDDALILETERALDMARAALNDFAESDHKE
jgi:hypothetical protein